MNKRGLSLMIVAAMVLGLPAVALAKKKKNRVPDELIAVIERVSAGRGNFFMRNAFDTDPSGYIGRFIPTDTEMTSLDEASTYPSACTEYITYKSVGGGGVEYDEYFNASTGVAANFGIPLLNNQFTKLGATVNYEGGSIVRVRYTLTNKMVAVIDDPAGLAECCTEDPGQCADIYISEFMEGTGEIMSVSGTGTDLHASVGAKGASLGVDVKDGLAWQRATNFPNPVYFAFKTSPVPPMSQLATLGWPECGSWTTSVPSSRKGTYFVGMSEVVASKRTARDQALRQGQLQAIQYLNVAGGQQSAETRSTSGEVQGLTTTLDESQTAVLSSEGVVNNIAAEAWCVEKNERADGTYYEAQVLVFFPAEAEEEVRQIILIRQGGGLGGGANESR